MVLYATYKGVEQGCHSYPWYSVREAIRLYRKEYGLTYKHNVKFYISRDGGFTRVKP